jgi:excisionase family DNA binding protein
MPPLVPSIRLVRKRSASIAHCAFVFFQKGLPYYIHRNFLTTHPFIEGKRPQTIQNEVRSMPILKVLRERTEPLTVAELAALLRVTEDTIQRWARQRQIPCIKIGATIRFDGNLLADWVELQGACTHPIVRPFLQPRAPCNPAEYQMLRSDLGELAPEESRSSAAPGEAAKAETE